MGDALGVSGSRNGDCRGGRRGGTGPRRGQRLRGAHELASMPSWSPSPCAGWAKRSASRRCRCTTYVASKEDLLDGMVDLIFIFSEIDVTTASDGDWKRAMRQRATSARD